MKRCVALAAIGCSAGVLTPAPDPSTSSPVQITWHRRDLSFGRHACGPRAEIAANVDRTCALVVTANGGPPHRVELPRDTCDELFAIAATSASHATPVERCPVPQPFAAGASITLANARGISTCHDDPVASRMAELAAAVEPDWERGGAAGSGCGLTLDPIGGPLAPVR